MPPPTMRVGTCVTPNVTESDLRAASLKDMKDYLAARMSNAKPLIIRLIPGDKDLGKTISRIKRQIDILGHYQTFDYALLLPSTKSAGAVVLASRLVNALLSEDLIPGMITAQNFRISFGIACIPEDFRDLSLVLAAAEIANNVAH